MTILSCVARRVFHKLLYGQKQQQQLTTCNPPKEEKTTKRKEAPRDTKLKLFLKRSSEPILNGLPFNQQQVGHMFAHFLC